MDKKALSESDICDKFIRPAMVQAGWNGMDQIFREYPLRAGRVVVRGKQSYRDQRSVLKADFALFHKANIPLAVVEAKDNKHAVGSGMAQALNYAELLNVPFSFTSNGDGFVFRDATLATGVLEQNLNHLFPLPPLAEQSRIVTRVEELMRLCDALEAKRQLEATQHAQLVSTLLGTLTASTTPEELTENWQRVAQHFDLLLDRPEAIDALEQTLLQLAVRGLLVPQDPTDEPASTLLARIRAEKDRLIVEGKIKRDKPLPPIAKDDQPLGLPTGWEWARLGSIFQVITDGDHLPPPVSEAGIAFLTIGNISSGVLNFDGCRLVPQDYFDDIAEYRRPARGDILYTVVGASYGRAVVVETDRSFCVQRHIGILKPSVQVNLQYLALLLGSQLIYEQATRSLTGTAQPTVGIRSLRNFLAPLPPLAEQSRIVTRITALRRLCGDLRQRLNAAQATQSHLAQALVESSPAL